MSVTCLWLRFLDFTTSHDNTNNSPDNLHVGEHSNKYLHITQTLHRQTRQAYTMQPKYAIECTMIFFFFVQSVWLKGFSVQSKVI